MEPKARMELSEIKELIRGGKPDSMGTLEWLDKAHKFAVTGSKTYKNGVLYVKRELGWEVVDDGTVQ